MGFKMICGTVLWLIVQGLQNNYLIFNVSKSVFFINLKEELKELKNNKMLHRYQRQLCLLKMVTSQPLRVTHWKHFHLCENIFYNNLFPLNAYPAAISYEKLFSLFQPVHISSCNDELSVPNPKITVTCFLARIYF